MTLAFWLRGFVVSLILASGAAAEEPKLTKAEIAKRSKPAVAFVLAQPGNLQGTAFCIHPSGLFLTNAHVVQNTTAIQVVLSPSLKDEKVFKATIVRIDEKEDLALLQVQTKEDLPVLALGEDTELAELMDVVACGYPFGDALTIEKKGHPSISITSGAIASLRMKNGELELIQLDVSLNPGNSGGPVLDSSGKVVGVVLAGIRGTQINFAIPIRRVTAFVAKPTFQFAVPTLTNADRGKVIPLEVKLATVRPTQKPPEVELQVRLGNAKAVRHALEYTQGSYKAKVIVLPESKGARQYLLAAQFTPGSLAGPVEDRTIKVGTESHQLGEFQALYPSEKPGGLLKSGQRLEGTITGLEAVPILWASQPLTANLSSAREITLRERSPDSLVFLDLIATLEGKELGRSSHSLVLDETNKVYLADLEPIETQFGPWPLGKGVTGSTETKGTIIVEGKTYPKGLGLHPTTNPQPSMVKYQLKKTATVFRARVAFNDDNDGKVTGPTHFEVYGDGKLLWKSKAITSRKQFDEVLLETSEIDVLELRVTITGFGWGAHAVWLDPTLIGLDATAIRKAAAKK